MLHKSYVNTGSWIAIRGYEDYFCTDPEFRQLLNYYWIVEQLLNYCWQIKYLLVLIGKAYDFLWIYIWHPLGSYGELCVGISTGMTCSWEIIINLSQLVEEPCCGRHSSEASTGWYSTSCGLSKLWCVQKTHIINNTNKLPAFQMWAVS